MSRSCRRAARLACLTSSCGLGPCSARNRSRAPCWLRRLRKRSWFFRSRAVRCNLQAGLRRFVNASVFVRARSCALVAALGRRLAAPLA